MFIPIHVWLVTDEQGVTLVDAGISPMAKGIQKYIQEIQRGPLQNILLTHGHSDHVGALKSILKEKNVPVYAHQIEIPYMEGEFPYPGRKKPSQFVAKGIARTLPTDDQGNLQRIAGLRPYHTPGHSPGHVVYYHEQDQVLLAGDLFTSKKGLLQKPMAMFTPDMKEAVTSGKIIGDLQPKRLEVCHGNSVIEPANQIDGYIRKMERELGVTNL
nr:MBL fold metallo-hydrolase [Bacillus sp. FJAT-49736]